MPGLDVDSPLYVPPRRGTAPASPARRPAPRPDPERGRGLSVAFSRRRETKKGLLEDRFYFQSAPLDSFRWSAAFSHSDYDTVGAGQFSRPGGRQLKTVNFSTLFVDYDPLWAAWHFGTARGAPPVDPLGWTEQLLTLLESGTPFNLTVGLPNRNGKYDVKNLAVTLRNLEVEERAGEPDARYIDVQLTEWRPLSLARRRRELPVKVTCRLRPHPKEKGVYRLVATWDSGAGEKSMPDPTLAKLAKQFYGSTGKWRRIAKANPHLKGATAGTDLGKRMLRPGKVHIMKRKLTLTVPDLPAAEDEATQGGMPVGSVIDPTREMG